MRDQTLFFQGHWNWLIVVLGLVVCSHSPFLNIQILSLRASLCLAVWMKCSAWAFSGHPIGSICYMFPHIGQPQEQLIPSQTEGWNQALVWSAQKLLPLSQGLPEHSDSKGLTLCRWRWGQPQGCKCSCWGEEGEEGFIFCNQWRGFCFRKVYYFGGYRYWELARSMEVESVSHE